MSDTRWIVILAGNDAAPLQQTRRRAELCVDPSRILYSLHRAPESLPASQCVVQPADRGTAPAILSCLMPIARQDPNATVAILPAGHNHDDGARAALDRAFDLAEANPDSIALLGARPACPATGYGWIDPGPPVDLRHDSFRVHAFYDNPSQPFADLFWQRGMLWNTGVMAANAMTYLEAVYLAMPDVFKRFQQSSALRGPRGETVLDERLYANLDPRDFSRDVLAPDPNRLIVHRLEPAAFSNSSEHFRDETPWAPEPLHTGLRIAG